MTRAIQHVPEQQCFEVYEQGHRCVLNYRLQNDLFTVMHTGVPAPVGGQGIAAELTAAALAYAKSQQFKVVPLCSYTAAYIRKHPEHQSLLA
ncbi:MAG TPA: GNAT family N-acetyltransferase [Paenalcaligenes sp.]|nr:GNAT family N-acetyltransferase [Paenalcaligenes sp.]